MSAAPTPAAAPLGSIAAAARAIAYLSHPPPERAALTWHFRRHHGERLARHHHN